MTEIDDALAIIRDRGLDLTQRDQMAIDRLLNGLPLEEALEARSLVYEGMALIVNDPLYRGDIEPIE